MNITIEHGSSDYFSVSLASAAGKDAFLVIRGCRVKDGSKGRFVSGPSKKLDSGKWFSHCWMSDGFQAAVLKAYDASAPKPASTASDDDIPF